MFRLLMLRRLNKKGKITAATLMVEKNGSHNVARTSKNGWDAIPATTHHSPTARSDTSNSLSDLPYRESLLFRTTAART